MKLPLLSCLFDRADTFVLKSDETLTELNFCRMKKFLFSILMLLSAAAFVACNNGNGGGNEPVAVTDVTLNKSSVEMGVGDTETLIASVLPPNATIRTVTWGSSDNAVATVANGVITAVGAGSATITVTTDEGSHTATCEVTVLDVPLEDPDVYVVGSIMDGSTRRAALWKNGELTILSSSMFQSVANAVFVDEDDNVYVIGTDAGMTMTDQATLWVNGEPQTLGDGIDPSYGNAVYVYEGDVYVAGHVMDYSDTYMTQAMLWKNGEAQILDADPSYHAYAYGLYVYEGDVYACGYSNFRVALWKNGEAQTFPTTSYYTESMSVFVSEGDVYVAGDVSDDTYKATLWTNGTPTTIHHERSYVYSVYVSGSDVYIAGFIGLNNSYEAQDNRAVVWKNGEVQILSDVQSQTGGVSVYGDDVYVAGRIIEDLERAALWKNGEVQRLSEERSLGKGIFVK